MKPSTSNNQPVTDKEIQTLADEAEASIDITKLKRRPSPRSSPQALQGTIDDPTNDVVSGMT